MSGENNFSFLNRPVEDMQQEIKDLSMEQEELDRRKTELDEQKAELERRKSELRKALGREAIETFNLARELHEMSDEEYVDLLEKVNMGDQDAGQKLEAMQTAYARVKNEKDELNSMSDEEYQALVDRANTGDQDAQRKLERLQKADLALRDDERSVQEGAKQPEATTVKGSNESATEGKTEEVKPAVEDKTEEAKPAVENKTEEAKPAVENKTEEAKPAVEGKTDEVGVAVEDNDKGETPAVSYVGILTEQELNNLFEGRDYDDNGDTNLPAGDDVEDAPIVFGDEDDIDDAGVIDGDLDSMFNAIQDNDISIDDIDEALEAQIQELLGDSDTGEGDSDSGEGDSGEGEEEGSGEGSGEGDSGEGEEEEKGKKRKHRIRRLFKTRLGKSLAKKALIIFTAVTALTGLGLGVSGVINIGNDKVIDKVADSDILGPDETDPDGGEIDNKTGERVSSVAHFTIDGEEFTYENMVHEGGYVLEKDAYFDEGKDNEHSMSAPVYSGEWSSDALYEAYGNSLVNLKESVGIGTQMAAVLNVTEGVDSLRELNDLASTYERGDEESYNTFATEVSDYINKYADGGEVYSWVISSGETYMSTYEVRDTDPDGDINTYIDMSVAHDYDIPVMDIKNADGESMFNDEEVLNRVRDIYGISSNTPIRVGWSARCNQLVVEKIIESKPTPTPTSTSTPTPTLNTPTPTLNTPTPTPNTPTPTPNTPTPTPNTPTPTPNTPTPTPNTPTPTPNTPTPTPNTPTPTPNTPTPTPSLAPKGPNANSGGEEVPLGTTPPTPQNGRRAVENDKPGTENDREPGSSVNDADKGAFENVPGRDETSKNSTETTYDESTEGRNPNAGSDVENALRDQGRQPDNANSRPTPAPDESNAGSRTGENTSDDEQELANIFRNIQGNQ